MPEGLAEGGTGCAPEGEIEKSPRSVDCEKQSRQIGWSSRKDHTHPARFGVVTFSVLMAVAAM